MTRYYSIANLIFRSDVALEAVPEIDAEDNFDVEICRNDFKIPEGLEEVEKLSRLGINPRVLSTETEFYIDWKQNGCFKIENGKRISYNSLAATSAHFEHFLVNEVIAAIFFQRGYFLLHGSAARLPNGNAAVFFGEPGAGKSTTLGFFIKAGCQILTDEVVVIGFDEREQPFVVPFLPILRLWENSARRLGFVDEKTKYKYEIDLVENFTSEVIPLQHIFSLNKAEQEEFSVKESKNMATHLALIANFSLPEQLLNPAASIRRFTDAALILEKCDFYEVKRNSESFESMYTFVGKFITNTLKYLP
jgi:hypothetical protein